MFQAEADQRDNKQGTIYKRFLDLIQTRIRHTPCQRSDDRISDQHTEHQSETEPLLQSHHSPALCASENQKVFKCSLDK